MSGPGLPLFESPADAPSVGLARRTDPATAQEAAASVPATDLELLVLTALQEGAATTEELARRLDLSLVTVSPRLKPLERKGFVRRAGRRQNVSGRPATVWEAV